MCTVELHLNDKEYKPAQGDFIPIFSEHTKTAIAG